MNSGSHTVPYTWGCSGRPFFFQRAREEEAEAEGGAAPRASLYLKGLTANQLFRIRKLKTHIGDLGSECLGRTDLYYRPSVGHRPKEGGARLARSAPFS